MKKVIELLEEIYNLTLRQEEAVNLGLIPRFMRLLEKKNELITQIENLDIEKSINMMYDENEKIQIDGWIEKINSLNDKNVENLKKQKKEIKVELNKIINAKKVMLETYDKNNGTSGSYIDNKK